jgi:hypothetical protein
MELQLVHCARGINSGTDEDGLLHLSVAELLAGVQTTRPITWGLPMFHGAANDEEWFPECCAELLARLKQLGRSPWLHSGGVIAP